MNLGSLLMLCIKRDDRSHHGDSPRGSEIPSSTTLDLKTAWIELKDTLILFKVDEIEQ
jgi:hypothetical protein